MKPSQPIPRSGLDQAPAPPPSPTQRDRVRAVLETELAAIVSAHGLELDTTGDENLRLLRGREVTLPWLCDFVETSLKTTVARLSADLIGGANVTRLDGVLTCRHPRLPYRRALRIVASRGWRLALGDELGAAAGASLVRFCGLLPVQVMYLPGQPQPAGGDGSRAGLSYILPWGGEVLRGVLPADHEPGHTVVRFQIDRLLGFVLGYAAAAADR